MAICKGWSLINGNDFRLPEEKDVAGKSLKHITDCIVIANFT